MLGFFHGKFQKFQKMHLGVQVRRSLGRLIVQTFTTDVLNHLINFATCIEYMQKRTEAYKETKN